MSNTPRVSVLLASRDGERHLDESLASLAAQTFPEVEVVAVDDGSHDRTGERLERFAREHPRARVLHTHGIGLSGALALAAKEARGELLARQDDDDVSRPERFARQVQFLDEHPTTAVVGTATEVIDESGRSTGAYPVPIAPDAIRRVTRRAPPFVHGSVMMRRAEYERAGGYRAAFRASQDLDLWLRMRPEAFANLHEPLYLWRRHAASVFARARVRQLFFAAVACEFAAERAAGGGDSYALLERMTDPDAFLASYPRAASLRFRLGEAYVREGRVAEARRFLAGAMGSPDARLKALAWWLLSWPVALTPRAARARAAEASGALEARGPA